MQEASFVFTMACALIGVLIPIVVSLWLLDRVDKICNKKESKIDVDLMNALLKDNTIEKIDTTVDQFINNAGDMYTLLKLSQNETHYISEDVQKEMSTYIFGTVKKNMTPTIRNLVGLIHNINEEEELDKYLELRIKLYMLNFMVNYNQLQDEVQI